jgi:glycosyltransferase involved in cell wall biosynthesis
VADLVTWLLPVRNGMPFLPQTLQSIATQTYQNVRILAWDNASTDETVEELQRWIPRRIPGTVVAGDPRPLGLCLAAMVERCQTELCARIDADDINLPERLERQVAFLEEHPQTAVLGAQVNTIDEDGRRLERWHFSTDDAETRWRLRWENPISHPAVLFRRRVVLRAGNYQECQAAEDFDLWMRVADLAEIRSHPEVLLHYRRSQGSVMAGVTDHVSIERRVMQKNASRLFPEMSEAAALELWEAAHPREPQRDPRLKHLRALRRSARLFAERTGRAAAYFTATETFRLQEDRIKMRLYERMHLTPLVRWKRGRR